MKRKVVKGYAILFKQSGYAICGHKRKFEIYATKKLAQETYDTVDGLFIVPCNVSYELPRKASRVK